MPPRYAYWTILVDEQPTAFRAGDQETLLPTFKRLQQKHPSARMVWFQNGKVWNSRLDAQEAMKVRGDRGRQGDFRQRQRDRKEGKLEWKPKGSFAPAAARPPRSAKREGGLEWKPKSEARPKPEWRPRDHHKSAAEGRESRRSPKGPGGREGGKLEWKPKGAPAPAEGRSRPSAEREGGREGGRRPKTWRPGGDHKDPRQKYKDAKKAKWGRFKQTIRKRWEAKQPRKKKDDE